MIRLVSAFAVVLFGIAFTLAAQSAPSTSGNRDNTSATGAVSSSIGAGVRKAPFSADSIDEIDTVALDGKRYHREIHAKVFRDSEGRYRQEIWSGMGPVGVSGPLHVEIIDLSKRVIIILEPRNNAATIRHLDAVQKPSPASTPVPAATMTSGEPKPLKPAPDYGPHLGTVTAGPNGGLIYHGAQQPEQLGTANIEGFTVTGTRNTWIAPEGIFGNDKPITLSTEIWHSPELKMDLLTKSEGPRSTHVQKLVNIQIADPDPLLFQLPAAGYTVKDDPPK